MRRCLEGVPGRGFWKGCLELPGAGAEEEEEEEDRTTD
jgi:hypothetical protein